MLSRQASRQGSPTFVRQSSGDLALRMSALMNATNTGSPVVNGQRSATDGGKSPSLGTQSPKPAMSPPRGDGEPLHLHDVGDSVADDHAQESSP